MLIGIFTFIFSIFIRPDAETVSVNKPVPVVTVPEDEIIIENVSADMFCIRH